MSIFSKMKNAKKAADQHKDTKAQTDAPAQEQPKAAPYKHVPSHAMQDALAGVPSAFREQDRELIKEHNKRRSMMTRNSSYMSTASAGNSIHNLPRNVSSRHSVDSFGTRLSSQPQGGSEIRLTAQNVPPVPRLATPNLDINRSRLSRQGPSESYFNRQPVGKSPLASHGKPAPRTQSSGQELTSIQTFLPSSPLAIPPAPPHHVRIFFLNLEFSQFPTPSNITPETCLKSPPPGPAGTPTPPPPAAPTPSGPWAPSSSAPGREARRRPTPTAPSSRASCSRRRRISPIRRWRRRWSSSNSKSRGSR